LSDTHQTILKLQEEVALLSQALEREKNAKRLIEEKLNMATDQHFEKNKAFFEAFEQANSRQVQLQFLASMTNELFSVHSIEEMFKHFVASISELLSSCNAITISTTDTDIYRLARYCANKKTMTYIPWHEKYKPTVEYIAQHSVAQDHWTRLALPETLISQESLLEFPLPLFFKLMISEKDQHFILLDIEHYCYSDNLKQTINTAAQQFAIAINRRIVEMDLSYNYHTQKLTLRQLEAAQSQLIHNEKMVSLGELSAGIAHEINNPLGFISSNLQVLDDYREIFEKTFRKLESAPTEMPWSNKELAFARDDIEELIASCISGVSRISKIVTSLKTFSRQGVQAYHPLAINEVINSSLQIVWNRLKYNYTVISELSIKLPKILGSTGELQQVFVNLFINALQAMEAKGTGTIILKSWLEKNVVKVTLSDNGCGIDSQTIKHLFEPFYTTKEEGEGTGLGLSVSYAILEKHNAKIEVHSAINEGTTFTLTFPVIRAS